MYEWIRGLRNHGKGLGVNAGLYWQTLCLFSLLRFFGM